MRRHPYCTYDDIEPIMSIKYVVYYLNVFYPSFPQRSGLTNQRREL